MQPTLAGVAELVDAQGLGPCGRNLVEVQVLSPAPGFFLRGLVRRAWHHVARGRRIHLADAGSCHLLSNQEEAWKSQ